jgi:acyl dehydratase
MPPGAKTRSFASLAEGEIARRSFTVREDEMASFAEVSGDHNPLHCDEAFARSRGYPGRVVYGALLVAKISQLIGMELPGRNALWSGLDIQFVSPLFIGQKADIEATIVRVSAAVHALELSLRIACQGQPIARGKAMVTVGRDD